MDGLHLLAAQHSLWEYSRMDIPTGTEFYERLIEALTDAGLPKKQTEIADFLGIQQSAVAKWKSGESFPELENAYRLAERARVSVAWLLLGIGSKKQEENMDRETVELLTSWDRMPQTLRNELLQFIRFRVAQERSDHQGEEPAAETRPQ